jgi:hypothetical protein
MYTSQNVTGMNMNHRGTITWSHISRTCASFGRTGTTRSTNGMDLSRYASGETLESHCDVTTGLGILRL